MGTKEKEVIEEILKSGQNKQIVLYNDDHNTFDHVITTLIDACQHSPTQAEQCAHIVHNNGKCDVKQGDFDELIGPLRILQEADLTAEIQ